jgi:outer membrane protein assembly factor BamB
VTLRAGLLLGLMTASSLCAGPAPAGDWPAFKGGPARAGLGPALGPPVRGLWRVRLKGSLYSSPIIVGGRVLLGSSDKRFYCVGLADGAIEWEHPLSDRVWGSGPAAEGGRAYVGCVDGCVHALSLADGTEVGRWCGHPHGLLGGGADVLSSPLLAGGELVFGSDDQSIYGVALGGGPGWSLRTGGILHDNGACACAGTAYMPSRDGKLYALGLADGAQRWAFQAPKPFNTVPACDGQRVWAGDGDSRLYCLSAASGQPLWSFQTGGKGLMSSPALGGDGSVVFGSSDHQVYCLDAATGALRWRAATGDVVLASPLITGATVWIGSYDGSFRALALADGRELWRSTFDDGVFTAAAASGDRIVVAGRGGELACFVATAVP